MHFKFQRFSLVSQLNSYGFSIFPDGLFSCHLTSILDNRLCQSSKRSVMYASARHEHSVRKRKSFMALVLLKRFCPSSFVEPSRSGNRITIGSSYRHWTSPHWLFYNAVTTRLHNGYNHSGSTLEKCPLNAPACFRRQHKKTK